MLEIIILSAIVGCAIIAVGILIFVLIYFNRKKDNSAAPAPEAKPTPGAYAADPSVNLSEEIEMTRVLNIGRQLDQVGFPIRIMNLDTSRSASLSVCPQVIIGRMEIDGVYSIAGDSAISKNHCRLYTDGGILWLEDLHSANHTFLNEQPVTAPVPVKSGDVIRVGNSSLMVFY